MYAVINMTNWQLSHSLNFNAVCVFAIRVPAISFLRICVFLLDLGILILTRGLPIIIIWPISITGFSLLFDKSH